MEILSRICIMNAQIYSKEVQNVLLKKKNVFKLLPHSPYSSRQLALHLQNRGASAKATKWSMVTGHTRDVMFGL